ncbi:cation diffusion facilitator family transporter [Rhodoligotrophos defluvii]|uniref:cation diffusion facilitator family transporter n=1 Tax=Rhodoligotrophos defluvii TaxID=2561934 RepID=UPI0010C97BB5|nr:cation diffusion facilitator family transporter [Rhodoligotrophos defluvii]
MTVSIRLAIGSIVIGVGVFALKLAAWWLTGSIALYSDALESLVNIAAAVAAVLALSVSARPADRNHPFGHHKAEYLSAVLEGVLIVIAAFSILKEAYLGLSEQRVADLSVPGLTLNGVATLINAGWGMVLLRAGRRRRSPALVADGKHLWSDVITSVGVLLGLILARATGWHVLDPLLAGIVALNILWMGYGLVRESVGGLMDASVDAETFSRIRAIISEHAAGAIEVHDLKTRQAARVTFVELHLVVPGDMTVAASHHICDRIEQALSAEFDNVEAIIHVEPENEAKLRGVVVLHSP